MHNDFYLEIRRLSFLLVTCLITGLIIGELTNVLLFGCVLYIIWTLFQIRQLEHWLKDGKLSTIPDASGIWGKIFDHLSRNKKREVVEKKNLKQVIMRVEIMTAALNDAVILLNNDQTINWLNKASRRLLNLKKSDINRPITNFIRNPLFVTYLNEGDHEVPLVLPAINDVEQRLEFRLNYFGDNESLLIVRDVSRLYKLEQMRKDFVANVSHELRTPLTVILGYIETLNDSPLLHDKWIKPLQQMEQQGVRMNTLINDLTMLSKLETDKLHQTPSTVPLKPLLKMICDSATTISGEKNHTIDLCCDEQLAINGNDRELHSAFSNLIMNAVKYSPPNKKIIVDVTQNFTQGIDIKIIDEGIGIEAQHLHRLTERFYRVDSSRSIETGGTGLGLAIVKHVLARHDARLHVRSRINQGSTFIAMFPKQRVCSISPSTVEINKD